MRKLAVVASTFAVWLAFWQGCTPPEDDAGDPSASTQVTAADEMDPEQRDAAIDRLWSRYQSLPHLDPVADAQAMADFLKAQPEFADAGVSSDLTVWGQFTDGLMYALVNNEPDLWADQSGDSSTPSSDTTAAKSVEPFGTALAVLTDRSARTAGPRNAAVVTNLALPTTSEAYLLHGFYSSRPNINEQLGQMLGKAGGYRVHKDFLTLAALQAVQETTALLVTNTHGGKCPDPYDKSREHFYLVTNTGVPPRHPQKGEPLYDDWKAGRICLFGTVIENRIIGVGAGWVQLNMNFGTNSLWINNACMGFDKEFYGAAHHKNLAGYLGWDESVHYDVANAAALFLVDRLTGANVEQAHKENPPQRPFPLDDVLADMHTRPGMNAVTNPTMDHSIWIAPDTSNLLNTTFPDAHLGAANNQYSGATADHFGLLAPTISAARIDEDNSELVLSGHFGRAQGKVTAGGEKLVITSWTPEEIHCTLTDSTAGDVQVNVRDRLSNVIQITSWRIALYFLTEQVDTAHTSTGSYVFTCYTNLHVRACLNSFRSAPHTTPVPPSAALPLGLVKDSTATFQASGTISYGPVNRSVVTSGSPDLPLVAGIPVLAGFSGSGQVELSTQPRVIGLDFIAVGVACETVYGATVEYRGFDPFSTNSFAPSAAPGAKYKLKLSLDDRYGIIAGSAPSWKEGYTSFTLMHSLSWSAAPATSPPDPNAAQ